MIQSNEFIFILGENPKDHKHLLLTVYKKVYKL